MKNTNNINHLRKKVGLSLLALLGQQVVAVPAYAAIYTWDGGGADSNMATAENWVGDVAPQNSSDGIIFTGTTQTTVANNLGYGTVVSLDFDAAAGAFVLQGGGIGSNAGIVNASANLQTFDNSQLAVFTSQTWDAGAGGLDILTPDVLLLNDPVDVNLTITGSGDTLISGVISQAFPAVTGAGSISKTGTGTLTLSGNNTYSGGTSINDGTVKISSDANLGDAAGALLMDGGALQTTASFSTSRDTTLNAGGGTLNTDASTTLNHDGVISGAGALTKAGTGTLVLNAANTYSGGTTVSAGTLQGDTTSLQGDITNNAVLHFSQATDGTYSGVISGTGSVSKNSNGIVVFSGANTYSGGTTIAAGTLQGDTTSLQGNILNNAALVFDQSGNGTYAGDVSGTGSLAKDGTGSVILTGANNYSGGTTVAAGTLQGDTTSLQGNILNNAALVFDQSGNGTYAGDVSGTGSLAKDGTGSVILTGANTYSGGTTVSAGTLQGNTSSLQGDIANNATLVFSQNTNGSYAGVLSGSGTVNKQGSGVITLSGANTFNGTTNITAGSLLVDGDLLGNIFVNNGTALGGSGSLGNVTVNSGGMLSPGNSPGVLSVDTLTLNAGATTLMEINGLVAGTDYDQINVTNTATLNGTLNLDFGFTPAGGDTFNLITAANIVKTGDVDTGFASIVDNISTNLGAALTVTPVIGSNSFDILIEQGSFVFLSDNLTANQLGVAQSLDSFSTSGNGTDLFAGLNMLAVDEMPAAFDSLAGTQHVHTQTLAIKQSQYLHGLLNNRLGYYGFQSTGGNSGDIITGANNNGWFNIIGGNGSIDKAIEDAGADYRDFGFSSGYDVALEENWVAGMAMGYARTNADISRGDLNIDTYQVAAYGRWEYHRGYVNGQLDLGYHDTGSSREIVFGNLSSVAEADYSAITTGVTVEAGHQFLLKQIGIVAPYVAFEYGAYDREEFTEEKAGGASLAVDKESEDSLRSHIGVRWQQLFTLADGTGVTPKAGFAWVHEYMDEQPGLDAGFAVAPGSSFHVDGAELDSDRARIEAGVGMQLDESSNFYVGYIGELAGSDAHQAVMATYSLSW